MFQHAQQFNTRTFKLSQITTEVLLHNPQETAGAGIDTVFALAKRANAAYAERMSVGRIRTCDIVVPFTRVSKFHGYCAWSPDRKIFFFTDVGATNGSQIDGTPLAVNVAAPVPDACRLALGPYLFYFFTPHTFYDHLKKLL